MGQPPVRKQQRAKNRFDCQTAERKRSRDV